MSKSVGSKQKGGKAELAEDVYSTDRKTIDGWTPIKGTDRTQLYEKDGKAIVSLRGTDPTAPKDLMNDIAVATGLIKYTDRYRRDKNTVKEAIDKYGKDNVVITGHSLGGTIAKELSRDFGVRAKTYNKGSGIFEVIRGGADRLACKINPTGARCKKAKLATNYRTKYDHVSLLGALDLNTKLVKNKRGIIGTMSKISEGEADHPLKIHSLTPVERIRLEMADGSITPELKNRHIELELKREEHAIEDSWDCCLCNRTTDSRLIRYIVQMSIIISVMIMCIVELSSTDDCSRQNLFLGILTLLLGIIMPQPSISGKK